MNTQWVMLPTTAQHPECYSDSSQNAVPVDFLCIKPELLGVRTCCMKQAKGLCLDVVLLCNLAKQPQKVVKMSRDVPTKYRA